MKLRYPILLLALSLLAPSFHKWVETTVFVRGNRDHCEPYDRAKRNVCVIERFAGTER